MKFKNSKRTFFAIWLISLFFMGFTHVRAESTYEPLVDGVTLHIRYNEPATSMPMSLTGAGDTTYDTLYLQQDSIKLEDCEITDFDRAVDGTGSITYSNAGTLDVVALPTGLATTAAGALQTYQDHLESANKAYDDKIDLTFEVWEQDIEAREVLTDIAQTYNTEFTYLNLSGVQYWLEIDYNEAACNNLLDEVLNDQDFKDLGDEDTVTASDVGEVIEDYLHKYTYDFGIAIWNETTLGNTLIMNRLDTWEDDYSLNFTEVNSYNHMLSNIISAYGHRVYSPPSGYEMDKMINTDTYGKIGDPNSYIRVSGDDVVLGINIDSLFESTGVAIDNILATIIQIIPESIRPSTSGLTLFFVLCALGLVIVYFRRKQLKIKSDQDKVMWVIIVAALALGITWFVVRYSDMNWT